MVHCIYKPDTIIFRQDVNDRCIHIEWHLILENISHLAFFIFKDDFCSLVRNLDPTTVSRQRIVFFAAIENNHVSIFYHVHKNGFHVCHIHLESAGIYAGDLLFYAPSFRKLHFFEIAYQPHSIIFDDNTFRLMKDTHCYQSLSSEFFFTFDDLYNCIIFFECSLIVFFFSFFAEDQKGLPINVEIILLESKIQERSLSTFKETCH